MPKPNKTVYRWRNAKWSLISQTVINDDRWKAEDAFEQTKKLYEGKKNIRVRLASARYGSFKGNSRVYIIRVYNTNK